MTNSDRPSGAPEAQNDTPGARPQFPTPCVVSNRYRFICLLIAKNASSTLRTKFGQDRYDSYEEIYTKIDRRSRDAYFTFATLRDPVTRLLSGYQEVSMRFEMNPDDYAQKPFFLMDDTPERFDAFLETLGDTRWDPHLQHQTDHLAGVRVDLFASVDRLQEGVDKLYRRLGISPSPTLSVRRSRKERKEVHGYGRFILSSDDLNDGALSRIRDIYEADIRLYDKLFADE